MELRTINPDIVSRLVLDGDLKGLTQTQRVEYYNYRCNQAGLDPSAKPFDLMTFQGRLVLYANKTCAEQLTSIHKLSHQITDKTICEGLYVVCCRVTGPDGRYTENMGAAPIDGKKGDDRVNAMLKATTKAIRRTVLAFCGLGELDETEVASMEGAVKVPMDAPSTVQVEWTDEERSDALNMINDLAEALLEAGMGEADTSAAIAGPRLKIGDVETSYNTWANRLLGYRERQIAGVVNGGAA